MAYCRREVLHCTHVDGASEEIEATHVSVPLHYIVMSCIAPTSGAHFVNAMNATYCGKM